MVKKTILLSIIASLALISGCQAPSVDTISKKTALTAANNSKIIPKKSNFLAFKYQGGYDEFLSIVRSTNSPKQVHQKFVNQKELYDKYSRLFCTLVNTSIGVRADMLIPFSINNFGKEIGGPVFPPYYRVLIAYNGVKKHCPQYKELFQKYASTVSFDSLISPESFSRSLSPYSQYKLYFQYKLFLQANKLPSLSFEEYVSNGTKICSTMEEKGYPAFLTEFVNDELPKFDKLDKKISVVVSTSSMIQTYCVYWYPKFNASLPELKNQIEISMQKQLPADFFKDGV